MIIGFTAARELKGVDPSKFIDALSKLHAKRFVYGGARGGDEAIAIWLTHYGPKALHHVIIPADRSQVAEWWKYPNAAELWPILEYMPDGTTYKQRNQKIVNTVDRLVAFPEYPKNHPRSLRSGTWQTIRMGKAKGIIVDEDIHTLREG